MFERFMIFGGYYGYAWGDAGVDSGEIEGSYWDFVGL